MIDRAIRGLSRRHRNALSRYVSREVAAQERRQRRDIFGGRHAPERRPLHERLAHPLHVDAAYLRLCFDHAVDAIAGNGARRDGVHGDVVPPQLERETVGQPDLSGLRRTVADAVREAASSGHRCDIHDCAAAGCDHQRRREPAAKIRAREAGIDGVEPIVGRVVLQRLRRSAVASVVDQRVDCAECGSGRIEDRLRAGFGAGIRDHGHGVAAAGADESRRFFDKRIGTRRAHDLRARAGVGLAHHAPDAFARAGNDGNTILQQRHGCSLPFVVRRSTCGVRVRRSRFDVHRSRSRSRSRSWFDIRSSDCEPRTTNVERRTKHGEQRTTNANDEPRTTNDERHRPPMTRARRSCASSPLLIPSRALSTSSVC